MTCIDCNRADRTVYLTQEAMVGRIKRTWAVCAECWIRYESKERK